jgi:SAM-dependent methyltransferase
MTKQNKIENKARRLWGEDLHKDSSVSPHCTQLADAFPSKWNKSLTGSLLEIGCGSGSDLKIFSSIQSLNNITAIDLGFNVFTLAKRYEDRKDILIKRGNALSLDFDDETFDVVYSFGIFHHTSNPTLCIEEARRVLKQGGTMFLYLYSSHEDMIFKRMGVFIERIIMSFFRHIPYKMQNLICILLSPICWALFTVPSILLSYFGFTDFAKKIPFFFGRHPFSLIGDLKDRLMSPINHRFTKLQIETILQSLKFECIEVIKAPSGLYIYSKK